MVTRSVGSRPLLLLSLVLPTTTVLEVRGQHVLADLHDAEGALILLPKKAGKEQDCDGTVRVGHIRRSTCVGAPDQAVEPTGA